MDPIKLVPEQPITEVHGSLELQSGGEALPRRIGTKSRSRNRDAKRDQSAPLTVKDPRRNYMVLLRGTNERFEASENGQLAELEIPGKWRVPDMHKPLLRIPIIDPALDSEGQRAALEVLGDLRRDGSWWEGPADPRMRDLGILDAYVAPVEAQSVEELMTLEPLAIYSNPSVVPQEAHLDDRVEQLRREWGSTKDANVPVSSWPHVQQLLGIDGSFPRGRGVDIVVIDAGISTTLSHKVLSLPRKPPEGSGTSHGDCIAQIIRSIAPDSTIVDCPAFGAPAEALADRLDDVLAGWEAALRYRARQSSSGRTMVLNNSWIIVPSDDAPTGSVANYSHNPFHVVNSRLVQMREENVVVLFCSGNKGIGSISANEYDPREREYCGPGRSILGANSSPFGICIGGAYLGDDDFAAPAGFSSEGPGALTPEKPDVVGPTKFTLADGGSVIDGSSYASAAVAAIVASLASEGIATPHFAESLHLAICRSARPMHANKRSTTRPWSPKTGWGLVNAAKALAELRKLL